MLGEFEFGDEVTFQSYKENEPLKRKVLRVTEYNFRGIKDGRIYYSLGHFNAYGQAIQTNFTTGESIKESKLFNLSE